MITVHKSRLITLTWWYGHWSTQENVYSKWLSANHRCESQVGLVSSVYKEWTLKDPWWCDAWSNVNGARHHPAQFWGWCSPQTQNARGRVHPIPLSHPLLSSHQPCFTYPAIAAPAPPRGIPGKRAKRWALAVNPADGPQTSCIPHRQRILLGSCVSKSSKLGWKKHKQGKFAGGHLRLAGSEDGTLNSKKDSQKETIRHWTEAWRVLQCLGWAFLLPAHSYFFFWRLKINLIKTPKMWNIFRPPAQMHVSVSSSETIR